MGTVFMNRYLKEQIWGGRKILTSHWSLKMHRFVLPAKVHSKIRQLPLKVRNKTTTKNRSLCFRLLDALD